MFRSSMIIMFCTLISRVLGLVRMTIIATLFGATGYTDAYFSSFKIANFFRQLLGEGALGTIFIPVYNEKEKILGGEEARKLIFSILNLLFIFLLFISVLMSLFSDQIINFMVSGYSPETKLLASKLLSIISFYLLFIGLAGMISAILNNYKKFFWPAFMPVFFNLSIIISAIIFYKTIGVYGLAIGVIAGGILQLVVQLPSFFSNAGKFQFKIDLKDPYLKKIFILLIPMLLGIFARQINVIVDQWFGSYLAEGSITGLENATRLYNLPLGIFGISVATVIFPNLSRQIENGNYDTAAKEVQKGLNFLLFLIIPSMYLLIFYAKDVIEILIGHGKYSDGAIKLTAEALIFYSGGLYFYSAIHTLSRAFYSMKDTKKPVIFSITAIAINILFDYLLVGKYKHIGLAGATAIASTVNFCLLFYFLKSKYLDISFIKFFKYLIVVLTTVLFAGIFRFFLDNIYLEVALFGVIYAGIWGIVFKKKGVGMFEG